MKDFDALLDGYRHFRTDGWRREHDRWEELADGQSPQIMVIACSDSRVDPAVVFDASPGEIFVVRNVAAIVPPFERGGGRHGVSSALEYAVTQLKVPEIVVMGHESCGGVGASLSQHFHDARHGEGGFIAAWIELLDAARERVVARYGEGPEAAHELELETVRQSIANLMTFPFVAKRVEDGTLHLRGTYFAIRDGLLHVMDQDGRFVPVGD